MPTHFDLFVSFIHCDLNDIEFPSYLYLQMIKTMSSESNLKYCVNNISYALAETDMRIWPYDIFPILKRTKFLKFKCTQLRYAEFGIELFIVPNP